MALRKSITTSQNQSAEYWTIPTVGFYKERRQVVAVFHLYKDQASYDAGATPTIRDAAKLELHGAIFDAYFGADNPDAAMLQKQAYTAAKALGVISDYGTPVVIDGKHNGMRALFIDAADI
jgi:hypothetical protein